MSKKKYILTICTNTEIVRDCLEIETCFEDEAVGEYVDAVDKAVYGYIYDSLPVDQYPLIEIKIDSSFQKWNGGKYSRKEFGERFGYIHINSTDVPEWLKKALEKANDEAVKAANELIKKLEN